MAGFPLFSKLAVMVMLGLCVVGVNTLNFEVHLLQVQRGLKITNPRKNEKMGKKIGKIGKQNEIKKCE